MGGGCFVVENVGDGKKHVQVRLYQICGKLMEAKHVLQSIHTVCICITDDNCMTSLHTR